MTVLATTKPSLWSPFRGLALPTWLAAGKAQRNDASGKVRRRPSTGRIGRNTGTDTGCCCGGGAGIACECCTSAPQTIDVTLAGVVLETGCINGVTTYVCPGFRSGQIIGQADPQAYLNDSHCLTQVPGQPCLWRKTLDLQYAYYDFDDTTCITPAFTPQPFLLEVERKPGFGLCKWIVRCWEGSECLGGNCAFPPSFCGATLFWQETTAAVNFDCLSTFIVSNSINTFVFCGGVPNNECPAFWSERRHGKDGTATVDPNGC